MTPPTDTRAGIGPRLRTLAELARLSNAPTIVTNSMAGLALGAAIGDTAVPWSRLPAVAGAMLALYIAGMVLNDVFDLRIDRSERPERPLPSGRFPVGWALFIGVLLLMIGVVVAALIDQRAGIAAGLLAVTIVAYDLLHARWAGAIVLMGLCRAGVYVTAALCVGAPMVADASMVPPMVPLVVCAVTLMLYTIGLSMAARREADDGAIVARRWLPWAMAVVGVAPVIIVPFFVTVALWPLALVALVVLLAWMAIAGRHLLATPPRIRNAVLVWIAGMSLFDAVVLALFGHTWGVIVAVACVAGTRRGHRVVAGT